MLRHIVQAKVIFMKTTGSLVLTCPSQFSARTFCPTKTKNVQTDFNFGWKMSDVISNTGIKVRVIHFIIMEPVNVDS